MSTNADKIAKILEDPESIRMISEIAQSFLDGSEQKNESGNEIAGNLSSVQKEENALPSIMTLTAGISKVFSESDIENTIRLITALKPYINKNRQNNADYILKMLSLLKFISKNNLAELSGLIGLLK